MKKLIKTQLNNPDAARPLIASVWVRSVLAVVLVILLMMAATAGSFAQTSAGDAKTATGMLKDVKYNADGSSETVTISLVNYEDFSVMKLSDPDRIVIDIYNAISTGKQQHVDAGGKYVKSIRYAQFDQYTARVVLNVEDDPEYGISKTSDGLIVYIGDIPENTGPQNPGDQSQQGGPGGETSGTPVKAVKQSLSVSKYFNIDYIPQDESDSIAVRIASYTGYRISRMTNPDRLVLDIPNAKYSSSPKKAEAAGRFVRTVSYAKYGTRTARITLYLNGQSQYNVTETKGKLLLDLKLPEYRNIIYNNSGDRVYFLLQGVKLTDGDEVLKKLYTGSYDKTGRQYTVTFPDSQATLGSGTFRINDGYVRELKIANDPEAGTTSLTFDAAGKYNYLVFTRGGTGVTSITILKPAAANEKIVAIDAGHGGKATGAIYKDMVEKDINLDIAQRLKALLDKKGVHTYLIRGDDTDVAIFERAYIANGLKAKLFISIHNNAMDDTSYRGTMTLYFPTGGSGFTGRSFADIIQQKLLSRLKTTDRKIVGRPDLVVLKATAMPSALAEVGFITNSGDRINLGKATFRQNAAQALCDAVVKALPKV